MTCFLYHKCNDAKEAEGLESNAEVLKIRKALLISSGKTIIDRQLSSDT